MQIERYITGPIQTNTYLVYDEVNRKGFIVDPGMYSGKLANSIKQNNIDIEYIILTHGHGDHIGGVAEHLRELPNCKVVASKDEKEMLNDAVLNSSLECCNKNVTLDADIYVNDMDTLKIGDMNLTFIFTPGHTKGGMSILVGKHLFSGDTLFRYSIGRTDFYGGDFRTLINSIKDRLFTLPDDTAILPGHMEFSTIGEEKRGNPFV